jgi:RES domain-containing protein
VEVYRICLAKYAGALVASGQPARWNLRGQFVLYAAGSRALACLENVVHRSGEGLSELFKVVRIEFPNQLPVEELTMDELPADWQHPQHYARCQPLRAAWYARRTAAVLRVPSSIIAQEFNYVINTQHPDFTQVRLAGVEDFVFDPRIKHDDL